MPPFTRIWDVAASVARFVSDGCTLVNADQYQARLETCDACDRRESSRCGECGCLIFVKARGRAFDCPLGKWPRTETEAQG